MSIVLLRERTDSILDDLEKALEDGVNNYKAMCRDNCILPRPSVTEIELEIRPKESAYKEIGLGKYAIRNIAEEF